MLNITTARRMKRSTLDLNITPLIDMVFILLIFFLVTTSFVKEAGVEVERPGAETATPIVGVNTIIAIDSENRVFMEGKEVDPAALRIQVERILAENPDGSMIVVADRSSSTGVAIEAMDMCRLAGAKNVAMAARMPEGR